MSVYSMTGYASTSANRVETQSQAAVPDAPAPRSAPDSNATVTVELRSVNGRFLDLSLRLPDELRSLEPALRELVGASFRRGKIELRLSTQTSSSNPWPQPQPDQLNRLSHLQGTVRGWLPQARELSVHEVLQWCKDASGPEQLDEVAMEAARGAVVGLQQARAREGQRSNKPEQHTRNIKRTYHNTEKSPQISKNPYPFRSSHKLEECCAQLSTHRTQQHTI